MKYWCMDCVLYVPRLCAIAGFKAGLPNSHHNSHRLLLYDARDRRASKFSCALGAGCVLFARVWGVCLVRYMYLGTGCGD
eukprot:1427555-Amphidinium_carterae.1